MLPALRHRNYRLFLCGQIVSQTGTWITATATSWLVYRLTDSAFVLGVVGFAGQLPILFLLPFSGVAVDRLNCHRLVIATQTLAMLQSFALAALTLPGLITVEAVVVLSIVQGVVNAFDLPARQAFAVQLVEGRTDLGNAIALSASVVNAARLLGPPLAGALIVSVGEGWCFFLDGVSYLFVIAALLAIRLPRPDREPAPHGRTLQEFRNGLAYVFGSRPIRSVLLLLGLTSLVGAPYSILMPVFAATVFHGGPYTLGLLMAGSGCGALAAPLWLATRKSVVGLDRLVPIGSALFGGGLMLFSMSQTLWLAVPFTALAGFGFMTQLASGNTLVQTVVDDDKRGRVMSLYLMAFLGTVPFGSLIAGSLSAQIGAPRTLLAGGACCIAGAVLFAAGLSGIRAAVRPVYIRRGIIPHGAAVAGEAGEAAGR